MSQPTDGLSLSVVLLSLSWARGLFGGFFRGGPCLLCQTFFGRSWGVCLLLPSFLFCLVVAVLSGARWVWYRVDLFFRSLVFDFLLPPPPPDRTERIAFILPARVLDVWTLNGALSALFPGSHTPPPTC